MFAVVGSKDKANWLWFLTELCPILGNEHKIMFISDRYPGIIKGIKNVFPECFHSFYMFHIKFNLLDKLKGIHSNV